LPLNPIPLVVVSCSYDLSLKIQTVVEKRAGKLRRRAMKLRSPGGQSLLPDHLQPWNGLLKGNWPADAGPIPDQNAVIMVRKVLGASERSGRPDLAIIMYCRPDGASNTEVRAATGDTWPHLSKPLYSRTIY
jgi:hypothetical protein